MTGFCVSSPLKIKRSFRPPVVGSSTGRSCGSTSSRAISDLGFVKTSATRPSSAIQLLSMTATRSQIWSMTFISCVMTMIVTPRDLLISRSSSRMERVVLGSRALVASSHSRYRGLVASAMATRCFCPPESCEGKLAALSARPTTFRSSSARFFASAFGVPEISSGKQMLRRTVRCSSKLKLWKIIPI